MFFEKMSANFRRGYSPKSPGCGPIKIGWGGVWVGALAARGSALQAKFFLRID